jgi:hypothetical protein
MENEPRIDARSTKPDANSTHAESVPTALMPRSEPPPA